MCSVDLHETSLCTLLRMRGLILTWKNSNPVSNQRELLTMKCSSYVHRSSKCLRLSHFSVASHSTRATSGQEMVNCKTVKAKSQKLASLVTLLNLRWVHWQNTVVMWLIQFQQFPHITLSLKSLVSHSNRALLTHPRWWNLLMITMQCCKRW